jgi:hypothetical protein
VSLLFRPATRRDNSGILALLEEKPAKGAVRICYTRRPDAYASLLREAPDARIFVWDSEGQVVGVVASFSREFFVAGQIRRSTYIGGLKKSAGLAEHLDLASAFPLVADTGADFVFCSVLEANSGVIAWVHGKRRVPANVASLGLFSTFLIKSGARVALPSGWEFRRAQEGDSEALGSFYMKLAPGLGMFPAGIPWEQELSFSVSNFYLVSDDSGCIVAAGALWDQTDYRQYVVTDYAWPLQVARVFNPIFTLIGYPKLPTPGVVVAYPMACFMVAELGAEEYLVSGLLQAAHEDGYAQMACGLAHSSAFHPALSRRKNISFGSEILQVLPEGADELASIPSISGLQCAYL